MTTANIRIAIFNDSTVVSDKDVEALVGVLQKQVDRDFGPAWGCPAKLRFVPKGANADAAEWWLVVLDNSDQANDLGYHDLTDWGLPMGKVFAKTAITDKSSWTVTASHELLEMLADPNINLSVFGEGPIGARLYSYEVCDPCEADRFGYTIDGTLVSDFVLPSWFESFWERGGTQFDFMSHINEPFQLLPDGYIGINDIASGLGWSSIMPSGERNARARPPQGSRRQRRGVPLTQRFVSTGGSRRKA